MQEQDGILKTFLMPQWLESGQPQSFDMLRNNPDLDSGSVEKFLASGLRNIVAHGMYDISREHLSFFSFHQLPYPPRAEQEKTLKMIVPAMHAAMMRCMPVHLSTETKSAVKPLALTAREVEVLSWIKQGKTNGEIGSILGISPHTVKHQVKSVMVKLRVNTRGQAVVEGMRKRHI
jgi:DNA-binding CsgD family transcriptional regulator